MQSYTAVAKSPDLLFHLALDLFESFQNARGTSNITIAASTDKHSLKQYDAFSLYSLLRLEPVHGRMEA